MSRSLLIKSLKNVMTDPFSIVRETKLSYNVFYKLDSEIFFALKKMKKFIGFLRKYHLKRADKLGDLMNKRFTSTNQFLFVKRESRSTEDSSAIMGLFTIFALLFFLNFFLNI